MAQNSEVSSEGNASIDIRTDKCIQVSRSKRPLHFYLNLTKNFLKEDDVVVVCGIGLAVSKVIIIAEMLKRHGLVFIKKIETALVNPRTTQICAFQKAKIYIWVQRTADFDKYAERHGFYVNELNVNVQSPSDLLPPPTQFPITSDLVRVTANEPSPSSPGQGSTEPVEENAVSETDSRYSDVCDCEAFSENDHGATC